MIAKDIMRRRLVTVTPKTTLKEAAKLFSDKDISGAPVVGPQGELIGVISLVDLVRPEHAGMKRVEEAMTPWGVSFEEDTPVKELARQMLAKRIHRVMITREGKLCGIVTSMDMLHALLELID